jgi:hypothetical protein
MQKQPCTCGAPENRYINDTNNKQIQNDTKKNATPGIFHIEKLNGEYAFDAILVGWFGFDVSTAKDIRINRNLKTVKQTGDNMKIG